MESGIGTNGHVCAAEIIVNGANLYESILKKNDYDHNINYATFLYFHHKIDTR